MCVIFTIFHFLLLSPHFPLLTPNRQKFKTIFFFSKCLSFYFEISDPFRHSSNFPTFSDSRKCRNSLLKGTSIILDTFKDVTQKSKNKCHVKCVVLRSYLRTEMTLMDSDPVETFDSCSHDNLKTNIKTIN